MHRRYKLCIKQTSSIAKRIYTILIVLLSSSGRGGLGAAIRDGMEMERRCESLIKMCVCNSFTCFAASASAAAGVLMKSDVIRCFQIHASAPALPLLVERAIAGQSRLRRVKCELRQTSRRDSPSAFALGKVDFMLDRSYE
jgi:hypothetical protein